MISSRDWKYRILLTLGLIGCLWSASAPAAGEEMVARVGYGIVAMHPRGYWWSINGELVSADEYRLVQQLKEMGVRTIFVKSSVKLTVETTDEMRTIFKKAQVTVQEFWVPSGQEPGYIDLETLR